MLHKLIVDSTFHIFHQTVNSVQQSSQTKTLRVSHAWLKSKQLTRDAFFSLQYIEKEEAMNILQFWLAADNFQNQLAAKKGQYDGLEAQNDAMILYDK